MTPVAFSRGEKMWYVDREWLVRFGVCMMHQGGDTAVAVDTCIRLTGEEMSGSRSEGLPDKREGDAVEASPATDRITPVNRSRTPLLDLVKKNVEYEDRKKAVGHFIPRINEFVEAMAPSNAAPPMVARGEWQVEPVGKLTAHVHTRIDMKRKAAEAEAQRLANATGVPWRAVRWYGEPGDILQVGIVEDDHAWEVERTRSGAKDAKRIAKRMMRDGASRCRITRTFSPSEAGSDATIPDQTHHADGVPVYRT